MSFTAATAFTADKTPEVVAGVPAGSTHDSVGVQEQTTDGTTVTHLHKYLFVSLELFQIINSRKKLRGILDSVLNIELKKLTNIVNSDGVSIVSRVSMYYLCLLRLSSLCSSVEGQAKVIPSLL